MAEIAPAVQKAIVEAYYPAALEEADNARGRAQNGYAIAGAVAAAIVAAGVFGDIGKEQDFVQWLGVAALALWLAAALTFMWAVAGTVDLPSSAAAGDANAFVTAALERAKNERRMIESRIKNALSATVIAVLFTLATLVSALTTSASPTSVHGTLVLTKAGTAAVGHACGGAPATVAATTDPDTLSDPFAKITFDEGCGVKRGTVELRLAKGSIAGFAAD